MNEKLRQMVFLLASLFLSIIISAVVVAIFAALSFLRDLLIFPLRRREFNTTEEELIPMARAEISSC